MLPGRIAIVTGADRGIGAATSYALSRAGASVVLASHDTHAIETLAVKIASSGGHAVAVPTDVTNPLSVRRLIEQTLGAFGRLDAAFNDLPPDAVALAMKYEIPPMARARSGHIVNLAPAPDVVELPTDSGVRIHTVAIGPNDNADDIANAVVLLCSDAVPNGLNGRS
jgi:glycine/D-amino acid oxidase-like deaminating enzyme